MEEFEEVGLEVAADLGKCSGGQYGIERARGVWLRVEKGGALPEDAVSEDVACLLLAEKGARQCPARRRALLATCSREVTRETTDEPQSSRVLFFGQDLYRHPFCSI